MIISLLISFLFLTFPPSQVPNYFRTYPTAKIEAAKAQKDLLVFFTSASCEKCDAAWNAYSMDATAVNRFVSTQVESTAFDGQILYDHFQPGSTPSWVIMDYKGNVKEKWQGGWKDGSGAGTLFVEDNTSKAVPTRTELANSHNIAETKKTTTPPANSTVVIAKETEPKASAEVKKTNERPVEKATASPLNSASSNQGFVIQAGYFGSETNAQKCLADLKAKGMSGFSIKPLDQQGSIFYRVWSIVYPSENEAQANLQKLTSAGIKGTVKACP